MIWPKTYFGYPINVNVSEMHFFWDIYLFNSVNLNYLCRFLKGKNVSFGQFIWKKNSLYLGHCTSFVLPLKGNYLLTKILMSNTILKRNSHHSWLLIFPTSGCVILNITDRIRHHHQQSRRQMLPQHQRLHLTAVGS